MINSFICVLKHHQLSEISAVNFAKNMLLLSERETIIIY